MLDGEVFWKIMRDVVEHPLDDFPRLACADFLQDSYPEGCSQHEFGRYIAMSLESTRAPACPGNSCRKSNSRCRGCYLQDAVGQLFSRWENQWKAILLPKGSLGQIPFITAFDRGFPARIRCKLSRWLKHGDEIVNMLPISGINLLGRYPDLVTVREPGNPDVQNRYFWDFCSVTSINSSADLPIQWRDEFLPWNSEGVVLADRTVSFPAFDQAVECANLAGLNHFRHRNGLARF